MIITIEAVAITIGILTALNSLGIIYVCREEIKNAFCTKSDEVKG